MMMVMEEQGPSSGFPELMLDVSFCSSHIFNFPPLKPTSAVSTVVSIHRMIIRMRVCFFLAMFHNSEVGSSKSMFKTDENVKDFFAAS